MDMVPCDEALPDVLANVVKHLQLFKQVQPRPTVRDRILMVPATEMPDEDLEFGVGRPAISLAESKATASVGTLTVTNVASKKAVQVMVCSVNDLKAGVGHSAAVKGKQLALFRHSDGRIFAVDAECPHAGGPLDEGAVKGCEVTCPLHDYKFDLTSGRCSTDPGLALQTYPVFVEDSQVWVEIHV